MLSCAGQRAVHKGRRGCATRGFNYSRGGAGGGAGGRGRVSEAGAVLMTISCALLIGLRGSFEPAVCAVQDTRPRPRARAACFLCCPKSTPSHLRSDPAISHLHVHLLLHSDRLHSSRSQPIRTHSTERSRDALHRAHARNNHHHPATCSRTPCRTRGQQQLGPSVTRRAAILRPAHA